MTIVKGWKQQTINEILERVTEAVKPEPNIYYQEIGIKSHGKGIFYKVPVLGKKLGNKRVFKVSPNCFVVNIVFAWEQAIARTRESEMGMIASHRFPMYRPLFNKCDVDYITYFFKTPRGKFILESASPGGAGRNKTLGQKEFSKIKLTLPPIEEQHKIAEILSAWDRAINILILLITYVKKIRKKLQNACKNMAMNYSKNQTFNDVFDLKIGGTPSRSNTDYWTKIPGDGFPWIAISDLKSKYLDKTKEKITELGVYKSNVKLIPTNTTLLSFKLTLGRKGITRIPSYTNEAICALLPKNPENILSNFIYHAAGWIDYNLYVDQAIKGKTLNKEKLRKLPIFVPPVKFQTKIINLLDAIDYEINLLESLLSSYKSQKISLMQQLLTGKIRVKV